MKPSALIRGFAASAAGEGFDWPLALGDIAIVLWLWQACSAFTGRTFLDWPAAVGLALAAAACSGRLGLHQRPSPQPIPAYLARSALLAPLVAILLYVVVALRGPQVSPAFALWFGSAAAFLGLGFRLAFGAIRSACPSQPLEIFRWLVMAGAGIALMLPYYGRRGLGSGDAYWYVVMLADFVTQLRHGVFPVWIGQSEYAFNGAVSPLRLAPWFQYSGGLLDALTVHCLEPLVLKKALLCVSGLATAGSAYLSLRTGVPRRPGLACLLGAAVAGESLHPCRPWARAACTCSSWRCPSCPPCCSAAGASWPGTTHQRGWLIVAALAGLMLSHTPTALWGGSWPPPYISDN